jgi:hypothetical protein
VVLIDIFSPLREDFLNTSKPSTDYTESSV